MPAAEALNKEEQELFEQMRSESGGKEAPKAEVKDDAKGTEKADTRPEAKADAKAETAKADGKDDRPQKTVPLEALSEARAQNKDLRKELEAMKQVVANGDSRLQKFIESVQKRADEKPAPKFEDDPAGALKAKNDQLEKDLETVKARLAQQDAAAEQGNRVNQHANMIKAKEAEFAKTEPAYWKASDFVAEAWRDEFIESGFDEANVPAMVFQKALATTAQAMKAGRDPAEAIWKIAKRLGFTGNKAAPAEEKAADKAADGETKLRTIEKGLDAAKSAGGGTGPDDMTFASISQMDDAQIEKLVADKDWWAKNIRQTPLH